MNNHEFANGDGYGDDRSQPCGCGKWWWHEEHFGGDKSKAVMAFEAFIKEERDQEGCRLAEPPRFFSVTEAEAWMAEQRRVRGIPEPEERLTFASQEEADDWLRQQAGEPYVPSGWAWSLAPGAIKSTDEVFDFARQAMALKMDRLIQYGMQTPQDLAKGFSVDVS